MCVCVCVCVCVCMCVKLGWKMKALHASLHGIITTTLIQIEIENRGKKKKMGDHGLARAHKDTGAAAQEYCSVYMGGG